jgi:hypothetical protein
MASLGPLEMGVPLAPNLSTAPVRPAESWFDEWCDFSGGGDGCEEGNDDIPGGGFDNHQSTLEWTGDLAQKGEASTSLAPTKPNNIENENQLEVSSVFTPPEIVLYNDGLGSSLAVQLPRV